MYARNFRVKLKPDRSAEFRRLLEEKIKPLLRTQKGFHDEISLVASQRNEAIVMSFWATEDDANAYNHVGYLDVLRLLSNVVERVPTVEAFEIVA